MTRGRADRAANAEPDGGMLVVPFASALDDERTARRRDVSGWLKRSSSVRSPTPAARSAASTSSKRSSAPSRYAERLTRLIALSGQESLLFFHKDVDFHFFEGCLIADSMKSKK